tara:strand:- start:987 stop:1508 length:522 start_codon:yes stop_codon:yes gene_type:complete
MTTILHAIENAATDTVEASGMFWRVNKVSSADLARVGFAALAMATPSDPDDAPETERDLSNRMTPKQAEKLAALQDATVAAGVSAVSEDGEEWTPLRLVIDPARQDADAGVLCVNSLPAGVVAACFEACMALSTDQGAAADRLRSFRSGTGSPARSVASSESTGEVPTRSAGA